MKIVYIGIDLMFPALQALYDLCEIREIVTCETDNVTEFNTKVCEFAREHQIPFKTGKIQTSDLKAWKDAGADMAVCGGYYHKIPVSETFPIVNIHPSLLPMGRGAWPMPVTILKGLDRSGITIHKMTEELDGGDILLQREIPVYKEDNLETLTKRLHSLLPGMMEQLVREYSYLCEHAGKQGSGEYWPLQEEKDYPITPDMTWQEAERILRAFYGYECIYDTGKEKFGMIGGVAYYGESYEETTFVLADGYIYGQKVRKIV